MNPAHEVLLDLPLVRQVAPFVDAVSIYYESAPKWLRFENEVWNIAPLHKNGSVKEFNIDFKKVGNIGLRNIARLYLLWAIVEKRVGPASARMSIDGFAVLSDALGSRSVATLKSDDFWRAGRILERRYAPGATARLSSELSRIGRWLSEHFDFRIDYKAKERRSASHGRQATEGQREDKLLADEIIHDVLALFRRDDIPSRDRYFLCVLAISVATGFRISELVTLPADCVVRDGDVLLVRPGTVKGGSISPRPVPPELADIVVDAVDFVVAFTQAPRQRAREMAASPELDWSAIVQSDESDSFEYFVRIWLSEWIRRPENRLIDQREAFFRPRGGEPRWVPLADLLEKH